MNYANDVSWCICWPTDIISSAGTNRICAGSVRYFLRFGNSIFGFGRFEVWYIFGLILAEPCWKFGLFGEWGCPEVWCSIFVRWIQVRKVRSSISASSKFGIGFVSSLIIRLISICNAVMFAFLSSYWIRMLCSEYIICTCIRAAYTPRNSNWTFKFPGD